MSARSIRIIAELKKLEKSGFHSKEQSDLLHTALLDSDTGISLTAAKIIARKGGENIIKKLIPWVESKMTRQVEYDLIHIPFGEVSKGVLDNKDFVWFIENLKSEKEIEIFYMICLQLDGAGSYSAKNNEFIVGEFCKLSASELAIRMEKFYFFRRAKNACEKLASHPDQKIAKKAKNFLSLMDEKPFFPSEFSQMTAKSFKDYFSSKGNSVKRGLMDGQIFSLGNISREYNSYFLSHAKYGSVPLEPNLGAGSLSFAIGKGFRPVIPEGALPARASKQNLSLVDFAYGRDEVFAFPFYFYVDESFKCTDCHSQAVFSAQEQKFWYEELQFPVYTRKIRCLDCKRYKKINFRLDEISTALREGHEDPVLLLEELQIRVDHASDFLQASLDRAKFILNRLSKIEKYNSQIDYWEGRIFEERGNTVKAHQFYQKFISENPQNLNSLIEDATERLIIPNEQE